MESIIKDFGIQPVLLAAQIVNFLILLYLLKRFLYKPVLKVLEERKQRIEESMKNAEEIEQRLQAIAQKEEESLVKSAKEGQKIIEEASAQAAALIEEGKIKAEEIIQNAQKEGRKLMEREKDKLVQDMKENISEIIVLAFQKVAGKIISTKEQKKIIEQEVKNLA